ncbi:MAG: hypothetical protein IPO77_02765 [Acidobacteria bacterium]|nr:hypothetical protein [Acidobacteriota bacterium]
MRSALITSEPIADAIHVAKSTPKWDSRFAQYRRIDEDDVGTIVRNAVTPRGNLCAVVVLFSVGAE